MKKNYVIAAAIVFSLMGLLVGTGALADHDGGGSIQIETDENIVFVIIDAPDDSTGKGLCTFTKSVKDVKIGQCWNASAILNRLKAVGVPIYSTEEAMNRAMERGSI